MNPLALAQFYKSTFNYTKILWCVSFVQIILTAETPQMTSDNIMLLGCLYLLAQYIVQCVVMLIAHLHYTGPFKNISVIDHIAFTKDIEEATDVVFNLGVWPVARYTRVVAEYDKKLKMSNAVAAVVIIVMSWLLSQCTLLLN